MKVKMTYISQSSDFAEYREEYLMDEHHTLGYWARLFITNVTFVFKLNVSHSVLNFMVQ